MTCSLGISNFLEEISSLSYFIVFLCFFALIAEERGEVKKKDLNDPDNDDGMITHLEPDIPECKVKWALGSITTNKAGGGMEFQLCYFKS